MSSLENAPKSYIKGNGFLSQISRQSSIVQTEMVLNNRTDLISIILLTKGFISSKNCPG